MTAYAILSEKSPICLHLHRIIISNNSRKQGNGSLFIKKIKFFLKTKYKFITLKVNKGKKEEFYMKNNFFEIDSLGDYALMVGAIND